MNTDTKSTAAFLRDQAKSIITHGRYPFRKVTTDSHILTSVGHVVPDLIFWINRDSCIAGGCVFFSSPPADPALMFKHAQACAEALALSQFAIWSSEKITIYQASSLEVRFEITPVSELDGLTELLDQFKLMAVIEAKKNSELSSWHLSNLCLQTIALAQKRLTSHLRRKNLSDSESAYEQAYSKLVLTVARMLTALHGDAIQTRVKPEHLDNFLQQNIPAAPHSGGLTETEPDLDEKSAILLHNLLRRLEQIAPFKQDQHRASAMLSQILASTTPENCALLNPNLTPPEAEVSVYSPAIEPGTIGIEVDTSSRLLLKNLAREILQIKHPDILQHTQVFNLDQPQQLGNCWGCFFSDTKPDIASVDIMNTRMRLAWPGHKVNLSKSSPLGLWQLTYIIGMLAEGSSLYAQVSPKLFHSHGIEKTINLIHAHASLLQVIYSPQTQRVEFLVKKMPPHGTTTFDTLVTKTQVPWHRNDAPLSSLLSCLELDFATDASSAAQRASGYKEQNLKQQLFYELETQGIPKFPTTYTYNIPAENLQEWDIQQRPWHICQTFMGSCSLCDSSGNQTTEAKDAQAHALILASYMQNSVLLPRDEHLCKEILLQYLHDLDRIYKHILEEAHVHLKTSAAAKRFSKKFWKDLDVPPWDQYQSVLIHMEIETDSASTKK